MQADPLADPVNACPPYDLVETEEIMNPVTNSPNPGRTTIQDPGINATNASASKAETTEKVNNQEAAPQRHEPVTDHSSQKTELGIEGSARSVQLESRLNQANAMNGKGWKKLSDPVREKLTGVLNGNEGADSQKALTDLTSSPKFQKLTPYIQQQVLETAATDSKALKSNVLQKLTESDGFQKLDPRHQVDALEVFQNCNASGRSELVDLANRSITRDGKTIPAFLDPDMRGALLIENLHHMATRDLSPYMMNTEGARQRLLASVMQESGKPGEIEQGHHGTCTVTTTQYMLCSQNPSEYIRIMDGLSTDGLAILRNGRTLRRVNDSMADDASIQRSPSERLFQAAMMDYCNGDRRYSNKIDEKTGYDYDIQTNGKKNVASLGPKEVLAGMEAIFGKSFHYVKDKSEAMKILEQRSHATSDADRQAKLTVFWKGQGSMHAVVFEKIENGRVYIRESSGIRNITKGEFISELDPPTRVEDPAKGVWSLSVEDFKKIYVDVAV